MSAEEKNCWYSPAELCLQLTLKVVLNIPETKDRQRLPSLAGGVPIFGPVLEVVHSIKHTKTTLIMADEDIAALVVDNGSGMCKVRKVCGAFNPGKVGFGNVWPRSVPLRTLRSPPPLFPGWIRRRRCPPCCFPFHCRKAQAPRNHGRHGPEGW